MINDFDLIILGIVCARNRLGVVKSDVITQKVSHSYNVLWLNLYLYPKWVDENYFDHVAKVVLYLFRKSFLKRWRFRLCFRWWRCNGWLGSSSGSSSSRGRGCSRRW